MSKIALVNRVNLVLRSVDLTDDAGGAPRSTSVVLENGAALVLIALDAGVERAIRQCVWGALHQIPPQANKKAFSSGVIPVHGPDLAATLCKACALDAINLGLLRIKTLESALGYRVCQINGEVDGQVLERGARATTTLVSHLVPLGLSSCPRIECLQNILDFFSICVFDCANEVSVIEVLLEETLLFLRLR